MQFPNHREKFRKLPILLFILYPIWKRNTYLGRRQYLRVLGWWRYWVPLSRDLVRCWRRLLLLLALRLRLGVFSTPSDYGFDLLILGIIFWLRRQSAWGSLSKTLSHQIGHGSYLSLHSLHPLIIFSKLLHHGFFQVGPLLIQILRWPLVLILHMKWPI